MVKTIFIGFIVRFIATIQSYPCQFEAKNQFDYLLNEKSQSHDEGELTVHAATMEKPARTFATVESDLPVLSLPDLQIDYQCNSHHGSNYVSDISKRRKRFAQTSRWEGMASNYGLKLNWYIKEYTNDMPRDEVRSIVSRSFHLWSQHTAIPSLHSLKLEFNEVAAESEADITILWAEGDHGDAYKFDGTGNAINILAHTFYPTYQNTGTLNGDIHLDDAEYWTGEGKQGGTAFSMVFVHEIGHALGLGHSKRQNAIMYPIYKRNSLERVTFDLDDKCALNWNYIGPSNICMFVWLMSEILPRQIEDDHKSSAKIDFNIELAGFHENSNRTALHRFHSLTERLKEISIPQCKKHNKVQEQLVSSLRSKLGFSSRDARAYGDVACNFLNGLREHSHRSSEDCLKVDVSETMESADEYLQRIAIRLPQHSQRHRRRVHNSHSQSALRNRHLTTLLFSQNFYNAKFYQNFLAFYVR